MIAIDGLTKSYGPTTVVDRVTLALPDAGVTSIIGPNGAGKSTLLSMVARTLGADAGTATVDGLDVFSSPGKAIAKVLSVLRQDTHMTARITVRELVEFGRFPHSGGRLGEACRAAVESALEYCDLEALAGRSLHELSGGQRQRAFVAMVLAQDTRYVLLDEPLNNLDMAHATSIMRLLRRLADERAKSIVLVLHDINYASAHSDRIIAMRDGAVVHDGPPQDVITPAALGEVFGMPFTVHQLGDDLVASYYR